MTVSLAELRDRGLILDATTIEWTDLIAVRDGDEPGPNKLKAMQVLQFATWLNDLNNLKGSIYTPTLTAVTNVGSLTPYACRYHIVNNILKCGIIAGCTPAGAGLTEFRVSGPPGESLSGATTDDIHGPANALALSAGAIVESHTVTDEYFVRYTAPGAGAHILYAEASCTVAL